MMHRRGGRSGGSWWREVYSLDFLIDGQSLFRAIVDSDEDEEASTGLDLIGCFEQGLQDNNEWYLRQFLLLDPPESKCGRRLLYVCPECRHIECGAYACHVSREGGLFIWQGFAYVNNYSEPVPIPGLGPFEFASEAYESALQRAHAI